MKNKIIIPNEIPDHIKIDMLENLISLIKEKVKDKTDVNFKTNLQINYYRTKKNVYAKIMGNLRKS